MIETPVINAYATCDKGAPVILVTTGLMEAVVSLAAHMADAELYSPAQATTDAVIRSAALQAVQAGYSPPARLRSKFTDPKFVERTRLHFRAIFQYVLGHELGHLSLRHVDEAYAAKGYDKTVSRVNPHALLRSRQMELEADEWGVIASARANRNVVDIRVWFAYMCLVEAFQKEAYGSPPEYLRDHPDWKNRFDRAERILRRVKAKN